MITLLLLGIAAALFWMGSLYAYPFRLCRRCGGTGHKRGSTFRRFGLCKRCTGTGRIQRLGSRLIHRTVLSMRSEIARDRLRTRTRKAAERSHLPEL